MTTSIFKLTMFLMSPVLTVSLATQSNAQNGRPSRSPSIIQEIVYKNANHISQKDLEEITGLRKGAPLDIRQVGQARREIEECLKRKGRYFAHVTILEGSRPEDHRVVFHITEGPMVRVRSASFVGNKTVASAELQKRIDTGRTFAVITGKKTQTRFDADVVKIEQYYKDRGFLDVRVTRELVFTSDLTLADVVFHIMEGPRYRVQSVSIDDPKAPPKKVLREITRLKPGDFYDEEVVRGDIRNITDFFGWRGFQVAVTTNQFRAEKSGLVNVHYKVAKRPSAVGHITIIGGGLCGMPIATLPKPTMTNQASDYRRLRHWLRQYGSKRPDTRLDARRPRQTARIRTLLLQLLLERPLVAASRCCAACAALDILEIGVVAASSRTNHQAPGRRRPARLPPGTCAAVPAASQGPNSTRSTRSTRSRCGFLMDKRSQIVYLRI